MTRLALTQRLTRLKDAAGDQVPLYIRQWLGEALTGEQVVQAGAEWDAVRALPDADPAAFTAEERAWLIGRAA